eukprot:7378973-Prymnesium_polylepis.1
MRAACAPHARRMRAARTAPLGTGHAPARRHGASPMWPRARAHTLAPMAHDPSKREAPTGAPTAPARPLPHAR